MSAPADSAVPVLVVDHHGRSHDDVIRNLPNGTRLYAAPQPPAEAQAQGGGEVPKLVVTRGDGVPLPDQAAAVAEFKRQCLRTAPPSAPVGVEGESVASYIDRLGERIRRGMADVRRFGANASHGIYMDDIAAEAITYAASLAQQPAAVDGAMVERACAAGAEQAGESWPLDDADKTEKLREHMRAILTAALAQPQGGAKP